MATPSLALEPGTLLVAPATEDDDPIFARAVILIVDREPNGITAGLVLNRPSGHIADTSARALLFIPDLNARAFWGGPMGTDPAILAQFSASDGLEWFHLATRQQRPFPLPDVGVIAVAEHPEPFEGRILRARLYAGLCVWGAGQLETEVDSGAWHVHAASIDHLFRPDTASLWADLQR
ncbi:MAG TPA: YqgE/AlgH family protein [Chloroflexota bacterium]|jgi:putative transcriptional regulator